MSLVAGLIRVVSAKIVRFNMVDSGAFWGVRIIGTIFTISTSYGLILRDELAAYMGKKLVLFWCRNNSFRRLCCLLYAFFCIFTYFFIRNHSGDGTI